MSTTPQATQRPLLWGLLVALIWLAWNPFNIMSKADTAGQSLLFNLATPLTKAERPPIAMVVLDDEYLAHHQTTWPMPYAGYALLIQAIANQGPRASGHAGISSDRSGIDRCKPAVQTPQRVPHAVVMALSVF